MYRSFFKPTLILVSLTLIFSCSAKQDAASSVQASLAFSTQPTTSVAGSQFYTPIVVNVLNASGAVDTTSNAVVTLTLSSNPGNASVSGTTSQPAVAGVATFNNLSLNALGTNYKVDASSAGYSPITSSAFNVSTNFFGALGNLAATSGTCPASGVSGGWCTGGTFATGTADGAISAVRGAVIDGANGFVYLANNNKIDKMNLTTGAYVGSIGFTTASSGTCTVGAVAGWCTGGTFTNSGVDGGYYIPRAMSVDSKNNILYVVDNSNQRIVKVNLATGAFIGAIGKTTASTGTCTVGVVAGWCTGGAFASGIVDGSFSNPFGVALDVTGDRLYISERNNSRVNKIIASTGAFVGAIGKTTASTGTCTVGAVASWCTGGTFAVGATDGMFNFAWAVVVDPTRDLMYIGDSTVKISKHTLSTGAFIGAVGSVSATTGTCTVGIASSWCTGGTFTTGAVDGAYNTLQAMAIDPTANLIYVADLGNNRVVKMSTSGAFIGALGNLSASIGTCPSSGAAPTFCTGGTFAAGTGDGMFSSPYALSVDPIGNSLIVGDNAGPRFVKLFK